MSFHLMRTCFLMTLTSISVSMLLPAMVHAQGAPYPASPVIADLTFEWSSHERHAPGSDNWPTTWADDGHQYAAWGMAAGSTARIARAGSP
jgi:hypothetical protein